MFVHSSPQLRCLGVGAAATVLATVSGRLALGELGGSVTTADQAVVQLCAGVLLACLSWGWAATVSVLVEVWRGTDTAVPVRFGAPHVVRHLVFAACGAALAGGLAAPGHASDGSLAGLPMPERAVGPAHPRLEAASHVTPTADSVVVRPGDSLWTISARALPPGSSAATISAAWHRLYRTNRDAIGPDPDLIHPGQLLRRPVR